MIMVTSQLMQLYHIPYTRSIMGQCNTIHWSNAVHHIRFQLQDRLMPTFSKSNNMATPPVLQYPWNLLTTSIQYILPSTLRQTFTSPIFLIFIYLLYIFTLSFIPQCIPSLFFLIFFIYYLAGFSLLLEHWEGATEPSVLPAAMARSSMLLSMATGSGWCFAAQS